MKQSDVKYTSYVTRIKNRVAVKKYYYEDLPKDVRSLAFTVSNLETLRQIEMVKASLEAAVDKGESFETWRSNLDREAFEKLSDARLETVYRTNVHAVYNQSTRYNAATSGVTPYLMYTAVGDERTRPEHLELDGITKKADSSFWNKFTPPLGFNCRCGLIPLTKEDAENEEGISRRSANSFVEPPEGFGEGKMGDITSQASQAADEAISAMPNSELKSKFKDAQDNIRTLVDIWFDANKNIFEP